MARRCAVCHEGVTAERVDVGLLAVGLRDLAQRLAQLELGAVQQSEVVR